MKSITCFRWQRIFSIVFNFTVFYGLEDVAGEVGLKAYFGRWKWYKWPALSLSQESSIIKTQLTCLHPTVLRGPIHSPPRSFLCNRPMNPKHKKLKRISKYNPGSFYSIGWLLCIHRKHTLTNVSVSPLETLAAKRLPIISLYFLFSKPLTPASHTFFFLIEIAINKQTSYDHDFKWHFKNFIIFEFETKIKVILISINFSIKF